ncbi:MAG: hypothetical protein V1664_01615 [Candidatus Uhrbacteria bacterium]
MSLKILKNEFEKIKNLIHPLLAVAIKEDLVEKTNVKKDAILKYHQKMSKASDGVIKKEIERLNKRYKKAYKINPKNIDLFKKSCITILELVKK